MYLPDYVWYGMVYTVTYVVYEVESFQLRFMSPGIGQNCEARSVFIFVFVLVLFWGKEGGIGEIWLLRTERRFGNMLRGRSLSNSQ